MARLLLTDDEWELIADVFPEPAATGRPRRDPRHGARRHPVGAAHRVAVARPARGVRPVENGLADVRHLERRWDAGRDSASPASARSSRRVRSTSSCGASTARRCGRRDVRPAVGKKRPRGAWRPRLRPFSRGIFDENPPPVRRPRPSAALPSDGGPNARIDRAGRTARRGRRMPARRRRRADRLAVRPGRRQGISGRLDRRVPARLGHRAGDPVEGKRRSRRSDRSSSTNRRTAAATSSSDSSAGSKKAAASSRDSRRPPRTSAA